MGAVVRRETEPRDASGFMMDTIAGYFAPGNSSPQPLQAPKQRRWPIRALLISAAGLLMLTAIAAYVRTQYVVLPDYTGANETPTTNALRDAGLVVAVRYQSSIIVRARHLIEQSPPAGHWLRRGATVVLTTSTGFPAHARLPHAARPHSVPRHSAPARAIPAHAPTTAPAKAVAATPAPAPTVEAATPEPAQCQPRSWLQRTWRHVFAPRASACR